ncbi:unnamed protein product [Moneuplotes crassus]|uniref:C2H2-type domain-containing protein n=1 Tax=Euplotes crassus TaxID=5936 RepID=A0AAD1Y6P7_EUPCR|nr:unnamed protein product [Moneuplotes crassus]
MDYKINLLCEKCGIKCEQITVQRSHMEISIHQARRLITALAAKRKLSRNKLSSSINGFPSTNQLRSSGNIKKLKKGFSSIKSKSKPKPKVTHQRSYLAFVELFQNKKAKLSNSKIRKKLRKASKKIDKIDQPDEPENDPKPFEINYNLQESSIFEAQSQGDFKHGFYMIEQPKVQIKNDDMRDSFREYHNMNNTGYSLKTRNNDIKAVQTLTLKGSTMNVKLLDRSQRLRGQFDRNLNFLHPRDAEIDLKSTSKLSTLRESRNDNISMILGSTPGFGVSIRKDIINAQTQTYQGDELPLMVKSQVSRQKYSNFAVNSERDARIKKFMLLKGLKGNKNYKTPNQHALQMDSDYKKHQKMKPVLIVNKVKAKQNPIGIACQTIPDYVEEEDRNPAESIHTPIGKSMSTERLEIPEIQKPYDDTNSNNECTEIPSLQMINSMKSMQKKRNSDMEKTAQILEIQTQGVALCSSKNQTRKSITQLCQSNKKKESFCNSKGSKYNNDLPSQIFSPNLIEHDIKNMQIRINPLRPENSVEREQGGQISDNQDSPPRKMLPKFKGKIPKGRKAKLLKKIKQVDATGDKAQLYKISKNIDMIMKKLNFSFEGIHTNPSNLVRSISLNNPPKRRKSNIECVGSSIVAKETLKKRKRDQSQNKIPFVSKSMSPFKKPQNQPLNVNKEKTWIDGISSSENTEDLFPSTHRIEFPEAVLEHNLQIFDNDE